MSCILRSILIGYTFDQSYNYNMFVLISNRLRSNPITGNIIHYIIETCELLSFVTSLSVQKTATGGTKIYGSTMHTYPYTFNNIYQAILKLF